MTPPAPPPEFSTLEVGAADAWVRAGAEGWARRVLERGDTLFEEARGSPERLRLEGRGPAYAVPAPGEADRDRWLVRHYRRGGAVASLLGDRYLAVGLPRPFREIRASEAVRARGIPTPRAVAGVAYRHGPFYRADLVTELVPRSVDLADVLFPTSAPAADGPRPELDPVAALAEAGALIRRLAEAGIYHPDLNAKNVLLRPPGEEPPALVLDLDRCAVSERRSPVDPGPMHARLVRSLEKWEARTGRTLLDVERAALARAVEGGAGRGATEPGEAS